MDDFLSKEGLEGYLYKIRSTLCNYDFERLNNVIFFNNEAVYEYLCEIPLIGSIDEDIGAALEKIEAFIPVSLTDNSLKFIMQAANFPEEMPALELEFSKKNKMDFLQLVAQAQNGAEWKRLMRLCETIRSFRASAEVAALT